MVRRSSSDSSHLVTARDRALPCIAQVSASRSDADPLIHRALRTTARGPYRSERPARPLPAACSHRSTATLRWRWRRRRRGDCGKRRCLPNAQGAAAWKPPRTARALPLTGMAHGAAGVGIPKQRKELLPGSVNCLAGHSHRLTRVRGVPRPTTLAMAGNLRAQRLLWT
jgi:hypothetical protein